MVDNPRVHDPEDAKVRPRLVWGGVVPALVGACTAGFGMMVGHAWLEWGGGGLVVLGLLVAWRGGVMYDTRGQEPPHSEVSEIIEGGEHQGISPQARTVGTIAHARAVAATQRKQLILDRSASHRLELRPLAVIGLFVLGAWLLIGQWWLDYPLTVAGKDNSLRDLGFAVIILLCALRLRMPTRSFLASALCLLSALLLILSGLLLGHDSRIVSLDEIVAGAMLLGCSGLTFS